MIILVEKNQTCLAFFFAIQKKNFYLLISLDAFFFFLKQEKMENLLQVFASIVVDLQGFNNSNLTIFNSEEQKDLSDMWLKDAKQNPNVFVRLLSPVQKKILTIWLMNRNDLNITEAIQKLEMCISELKKFNKPPSSIPVKKPRLKRQERLRSGFKEGVKKIFLVPIHEN
jgi:hypothetical protein